MMLYITEHEAVRGLPIVEGQTLSIESEPAKSKPLHPSSTAVRLQADENCLVSFGDGTHWMPLTADMAEWFEKVRGRPNLCVWVKAVPDEG